MHLPFFTSVLLSSFLVLCLAATQDSGQDSSTEYTDSARFRDAVLDVTNTYRKQHNATTVMWNETLAEFAADWGKRCKFEHSGGPYGENLASGYANVTQSIVGWGEEREKYDFESGEFSASTGHFTQLVWKPTTQVGCSRTRCNAGQQGGEGDAPGWYLVCEYSPAGNVIGAFTENVQAAVPAEEQPQGPDASGVPSPEGSIAVALKISRRPLWAGLLLGVLGAHWMHR